MFASLRLVQPSVSFCFASPPVLTSFPFPALRSGVSSWVPSSKLVQPSSSPFTADSKINVKINMALDRQLSLVLQDSSYMLAMLG